MFDKFTDRANRVFFKASRLATQWGMKIKSDHLIAGLLAESPGIGGHVLSEAGITLKIINNELNEKYDPKLYKPSSEAQLDEDGKTVIETAIAITERLNNNYLGTEHILLGILNSENEGKEMLKVLKIDIDEMRNEIYHLLNVVVEPTIVSVDQKLIDIKEALTNPPEVALAKIKKIVNN